MHQKQEKNDEIVNNEEKSKEETGSKNKEDVNVEQIIKERDEINSKLIEKTKEAEEYLDHLQRTLAEFDNYKKRINKEKDTMFNVFTSEIILSFLPVLDNLESAFKTQENKEKDAFFEGIELVYKQLKDILKQYNVEEIKSVGEKFDPKLHEAVMHTEDSAHEDGYIIEELRKGYRIHEKVIRHSMVKVVN
jgi:molecular chaperone GrpE